MEKRVAEIYECVRYRNMGFSLKETEKLLKEADGAMLESMLEKRVADISLGEHAMIFPESCSFVRES